MNILLHITLCISISIPMIQSMEPVRFIEARPKSTFEIAQEHHERLSSAEKQNALKKADAKLKNDQKSYTHTELAEKYIQDAHASTSPSQKTKIILSYEKLTGEAFPDAQGKKITQSEPSTIHLSQEHIPQATQIADGTSYESASLKISNEPVQAEPVEPPATPIDAQSIYYFDPHNVYDVDAQAPAQESTLIEKSKSNIFDRFNEYNQRRIGQADEIKSGQALIKIDKSMEQIDLSNLSDVEYLKFYEYKKDLEFLKEQWLKDPTQIKSEDLANFLNEFKQFSTDQLKSYRSQDFNRTSWQKLIDAIQDFYDIIFSSNTQTTVVAKPLQEEFIEKN